MTRHRQRDVTVNLTLLAGCGLFCGAAWAGAWFTAIWVAAWFAVAQPLIAVVVQSW